MFQVLDNVCSAVLYFLWPNRSQMTLYAGGLDVALIEIFKAVAQQRTGFDVAVL
jgi:hypothetical protein